MSHVRDHSGDRDDADGKTSSCFFAMGRDATITGVGDDPFGRFVLREMRRLGVDDRYVVVADLHMPVTFCEIFPPDSFPRGSTVRRPPPAFA